MWKSIFFSASKRNTDWIQKDQTQKLMFKPQLWVLRITWVNELIGAQTRQPHCLGRTNVLQKSNCITTFCLYYLCWWNILVASRAAFSAQFRGIYNHFHQQQPDMENVLVRHTSVATMISLLGPIFSHRSLIYISISFPTTAPPLHPRPHRIFFSTL